MTLTSFKVEFNHSLRGIIFCLIILKGISIPSNSPIAFDRLINFCCFESSCIDSSCSISTTDYPCKKDVKQHHHWMFLGIIERYDTVYKIHECSQCKEAIWDKVDFNYIIKKS